MDFVDGALLVRPLTGSENIAVHIADAFVAFAFPELRRMQRLQETKEDVRRAEVEEEIGYSLGDIRQVFDCFMSPGSVTERLHLFIAEYDASMRIGAGGGLEGEGEEIEVVELSFDEAMARVADGRIRDAKTVVLLQHAALTVFA